MRAIALVILLTACQGSGDDDYRIIPGGDDTTITPRPDAPPVEPDAPDGGRAIAGRVCVLRDARSQVCKSTGAGGLRVTLGAAETTTEEDGTFSIAAPSGTNLLWHVTGTDLVTSVMPLAATATIPALDVNTYNTMLLGSVGTLLSTDESSVFVRVVQADVPLGGAVVTSTPSSTYGVRYDGTDEATWSGTATGPQGVAWIVGAAGPTMLTVVPPAGIAVGLDVPVEASAITFVTVDVP